MPSLLLIPIRVDALNLSENTPILAPKADFSLLPYVQKDEKGKIIEDRNPETAFLSESITQQPFQDESLILNKGIHLHWAMPDALVHQPHDTSIFPSDKQSFPALPNRWLVSRRNPQSLQGFDWIVESDYLHPPSTDQTLANTYITVPLPETENPSPPFRYMGRSLSLAEWQAENTATQNQHDYWPKHWDTPLTAAGYGEPTFAAFYPNCRSAFGFYDNYTSIPSSGVEYQVLGWYDNINNDYLYQQTQAYHKRPLTIHKRDLTQWFRQMGEQAWQAMVDNRWLEVLTTQIAPKGYGSGTIAPAIQQFLYPTPIITLATRDASQNWTLTTKLPPQLGKDIPALLERLPETIIRHKQILILPKQRLTDRYGAATAAALWEQFSQSPETFELHPEYLAFTRAFKPTPPNAYNTNIPSTILPLLTADLKRQLLLNPNAHYTKLSQAEFLARFPKETTAWNKLIKRAYLFPTEGEEDNPTRTTLPIGKSNTLSFNGKLPFPTETIQTRYIGLRKPSVITYFLNQAETLWKKLFNLPQATQASYTGLLPTKATLNLTKPLPSLGLPNIKNAQIYQRLFSLTLAQVTNLFGPQKAKRIWLELLSKKWITYITGDLATINPKTSRLKGKPNAPITQEDLDTVDKKLLSQSVTYNVIKKAYGSQALPLWKALLAKGWLTMPTDSQGNIPQKEAFFEYTDNVDKLNFLTDPHKADLIDFLTYRKKAELYSMLQSRFKWHIGITLKRSALQLADDDDEAALWEELLQKQWLLQLEPNEGIIEPLKYRKPLALRFRKYRNQIERLCNHAIVNDPIPQHMLLFGTVTLQEGSTKENGHITNERTSVTIANTGTEALSARLAHLIDDSNKALIEDQLEAILFSRKLKKKGVDIGAKFQEMRHEKEFMAHQGALLWTIRADRNANNPEANTQITLPLDLAHLLNELNLAQQAYQKALDEIDSLKRELFGDWYKYMIAAYPPDDDLAAYPSPDRIKYFINHYVIRPLYQKINHTGELVLAKDGHKVLGAKADALEVEGQISVIIPENTLAGNLARKINTLIEQIEAFNIAQLETAKPRHYNLQWIPGPRYWEPTNPVILLRGKAVTPSERHFKDGKNRDDELLECPILESTSLQFPFSRTNLPIEVLRNEILSIEQMVQRRNLDYIGFKTVSEKPWNPFLLEWSVRFTSVNDPTTIDDTNYLGYNPDFLSNNYDLPEEKPDFTPILDKADLSIYQSDYQGITPLTDSIPQGFAKRFANFLHDHAPADLTALQAAMATDEQKGSTTAQAWLTAWKQGKDLTNPNTQTLYHALAAYYTLSLQPILSQALSGFNRALLMLRETMQLPIADPLAFPEYTAFTQKVRQFVGRNNILAPQPQDHFNPIRAGAINILKMRLIDTFGRSHPLNLTDLVSTEKMDYAGHTNLIRLSPRLSQAARLNFRWISADPKHQDMEMNTHPATTPICGWLVPNKLDDSLLIYNAQGNMLGLINEAAHWQSPPGGSALAIAQITNPHLKAMVSYITSKGKAFMKDFLTTLDNSLEYIQPDYAAEHQDFALLMGRPIALVRASVGFELQGLPAIHRNWNLFRQDMERAFAYKKDFNPAELDEYIKDIRETFGFTKVKIPVRLGDYRQLSDGLIGYWKPLTVNNTETDFKGTIDSSDIFFAPQTNAAISIKDPNIKTGEKENFYVQLAIDDPTIILPLLIDPTGCLHATSGILPTKSIEIPLDQYKSILKKIQITFLTAPIISPTNKVRVPLPTEPGYEWTWLSATGTTATTPLSWKETPAITFESFAQQWNLGLARALWAYLQTKDIHWLAPQGKQAEVLLPTQRKAPKLFSLWGSNQEDIDLFLRKLLPSVSQTQIISASQFTAAWLAFQSQKQRTKSDAYYLWQYLQQLGWIHAQNTYLRLNIPQMQKDTTFTGIWKGLEEMARASLREAAWSLGPINHHATFMGISQIYDGWLKLIPNPKK